MFEVLTTSGPVVGHRHPQSPQCIRFLGIPFAAAPVGELWLQAPVPPQPWSEPRDCSTPGPTPQKRPYSDDSLLKDESIPGTEILNLNVFMPENAEEAPVLVWIHGGGFKAGVALSPLSDGREFAKHGIVVVSISYRLGFEGFGWVEGAPANRGLLDQQVALRWVQDNISNFGGDPNRVTIAGQSAGGGSVLAHLVMESSADLFARAISMSGVLPPMPEKEAIRRANLVSAKFGVKPTLEALRPFADRIIEVEPDVEREIFSHWPGAAEFVAERLHGFPMSDLPFIPWQDEEILPISVMEGIRQGRGVDKPLLLTTTAEEFTNAMEFAGPMLNHLDPLEILREAKMDNPEQYLSNHPRAQTTVQVMGQIVTDSFFTWPAQEIRTVRDTMGADTTYDLFTWYAAHDDPDLTQPEFQWSSHCVDLPFAWNLLDEPMAKLVVGDNPPQELADRIHGLWVHFIKA